jgi:tetratricopeptide (TPR) repeat protein
MRMADAAGGGDVPRHLAAAVRLAREARVEDLHGEIEAARSAAGGSLDPDDEVLAGTLLASARYNTGQLEAARQELDRVHHALPLATPVRQGRFHATVGVIAHGGGDEDRAIAELLGALAILDGEREPSEELATVLGNCAVSLAHTQMFTLGVETGERAVAVAAKAGAPTGRFRFQAGEAALTWAIRLEHLRMSNEAADQWQAATGHYTATMPHLDDLGALFGAQAYARLALCLARTDRPAEARRHLDAAHRMPRQAVHVARRVLEHASGAVLLAERRYRQAASVLALAWPAVRQLHRPPWTEDVAYLLAVAAERAGDVPVALRWYREVHERYGRSEYQVAIARATAARLRVEKETLLQRSRQLETDARSDPLTGWPTAGRWTRRSPSGQLTPWPVTGRRPSSSWTSTGSNRSTTSRDTPSGTRCSAVSL